jgi:hypothetical protein
MTVDSISKANLIEVIKGKHFEIMFYRKDNTLEENSAQSIRFRFQMNFYLFAYPFYVLYVDTALRSNSH